ncbi:SMC-Scp complex subunit ScpB [Calditrichota bacterium GD2]
MEDKKIATIEALIFASESPITVQKIKEILEDVGAKEIKTAVSELNRRYEEQSSALQIIEVAGGFQMVTRPEFAEPVSRLYKARQGQRLTQKALETLAIIAYKQPITKQTIEHIRGVNVDWVLRTLIERNLVTVVGREKAPGNPLLYGTTKEFLEYFGLKSLNDLPKLKEIDEILKGDEKFLESLDQVALEQLAPEELGIANPEELMEKKQNENHLQQQNKAENGTRES